MTKNSFTALIETLERIKKYESGATLENYISAHYTTGYQYSITRNNDTNTAETVKKAAEMIQALKGNCGIWYHNKKFYIETSYHTNSILTAGLNAWNHDQLSIYDWKNDKYINIHS